MTFWFVLVSYLAAVNPARLRPALPETDGRLRWFTVFAGMAITLGLAALGVALSVDVLHALDISLESWRIAAGAIVGVVGVRVLVSRERALEPQLSGLGAAIVPVTFPLLITPELVALVVLYGATESAWRSLGVLAIALTAAAASGALPQRRPRLWLATARFFGAILVGTAIALAIEGIRDV